MRRVVIHRPGGYGRLELEDHPDLEPAEGEVRVDVQAAGINFADCLVRMGLYQSARDYVGWPITPGFEVAGRIGAVGPGVDDLSPGDQVLALTRFGGYAAQVVVPRVQVFRRPASLSAEQAAAFAAVHLTAWYALVDLAHVRSGRTMLVHSAAGGVGSALVRIGKRLGCRVIGVVGASHKVEPARELGADAVIDKSTSDLWAEASRLAPTGYDVVLDANGVATLRRSYQHLAPGGRLVAYGFHTMLPRGRGRPSWPKLAVDWLRTPRFDPLAMTNENRSVLAFNLSYMFERTDLLHEAMGELLAWLEAEDLAPPAVTSVPFAEVTEAHRALESGQTVGKLVLHVEGVTRSSAALTPLGSSLEDRSRSGRP